MVLYVALLGYSLLFYIQFLSHYIEIRTVHEVGCYWLGAISIPKWRTHTRKMHGTRASTKGV